DDLIACLHKAMAILTTVASSRQGLLNATTVKVKGIWLGNALSLSDQGMQHAWYKDKAMLAEAQEAEQILNEKQLVFLANPGILDGQAQFSWPIFPTMVLTLSQRKRFVPQQELSAKQAFWYHMSYPSNESSDASPVKMEALKELPKIRTTPDARTEGE
nr:hypothetical protein [Tanacetum cinerariifolium]